MIREVPLGEYGKRANFVFCYFFARNCNPYKGYELNDIPVVNLVLLQLRWDGLLGGCGGTVEDTDATLEDALFREIQEEMNYNIFIEQLKPLKTYELYLGAHTHSYSYEVTYEELKAIRDGYSTAKHASAEVAGVNLCHISRYSKGQNREAGYNNLMTQNFIGTAKMELEHLVQSENLLISYL
ncbi:TPA: NUDIX hydrolase [Escherichia coli]|nr:NUDIX hydrolase [Escherichia coli]